MGYQKSLVAPILDQMLVSIGTQSVEYRIAESIVWRRYLKLSKYKEIFTANVISSEN